MFTSRCRQGIRYAVLGSLILWSQMCLANREAEHEVVNLFDGETLAGWKPVGNASWRVVEGVIEAQGMGEGYLVSETPYTNYRLTLEFWVDATTNSGVFVSCPGLGEPNPKDCYEINIWDNHPKPPARTGSIVFEVMPPLAHRETVGKWNAYEITSINSRLEVRLNGTVTAILANARTDPGHIALQHAESGTVRFRELRLYPQIIE